MITKKKHFMVLLIIILYILVTNNLNPVQYCSSVLPREIWSEDSIAHLYTETTSTTSARVGAGGGEVLYGLIKETDLPWFNNPPLDLRDLRTRYDADNFITAFRTTLPTPFLDEAHNVTTAANYLCGNVLLPGKVFSLNKAIGPRTVSRGFKEGPLYVNGQVNSTIGGGICKVATTIYNLAIHGDLRLVERHPHSMPVPYAPPGRDATVLWGSKDLRFVNDKEQPVILWASVEDNTLYAALYGNYDPPLIEWCFEELGEIPTWTIRRKNSQLYTGEKRFIPGVPGLTVKTWINIKYREHPPSRRYLGVDHYRPLPNYLEVGTK
ncbi:MAG TPA: VanW family protein [Natronincola sp.]|nr:VanW family protein [Natronincola sp.]